MLTGNNTVCPGEYSNSSVRLLRVAIMSANGRMFPCNCRLERLKLHCQGSSGPDIVSGVPMLWTCGNGLGITEYTGAVPVRRGNRSDDIMITRSNYLNFPGRFVRIFCDNAYETHVVCFQ